METASRPCHIIGMTKTPKRPRDPNQLAKFIVDLATGRMRRASRRRWKFTRARARRVIGAGSVAHAGALRNSARCCRSALEEILSGVIFIVPMSPLRNVVAEIKKHWYLRLVGVHIVVGFHIGRQLNTIANDLFAALNRRVWRARWTSQTPVAGWQNTRRKRQMLYQAASHLRANAAFPRHDQINCLLRHSRM